MIVNEATMELIESFEGFVGHWYKDPVGIWTVAYGHTDAAGEPKYARTKDKKFTKTEGRTILERDLAQYAAVVKKSVHVPLNDNQYGALVSFTFNLGPSNFLKSTLLKKLNNEDYEGAAAEFARWNRAGGQVLKGLTRRRAAEADLFRSGATPQTPASDDPPSLWASIFAFLKLLLSLLPKRNP